MIDWYAERDRLNQGDVCILYDDTTVKLDRRVPGDGTDWYVLDWWDNGFNGRWTDNDRRIHPSDIVKGPAW